MHVGASVTQSVSDGKHHNFFPHLLNLSGLCLTLSTRLWGGDAVGMLEPRLYAALEHPLLLSGTTAQRPSSRSQPRLMEGEWPPGEN